MKPIKNITHLIAILFFSLLIVITVMLPSTVSQATINSSLNVTAALPAPAILPVFPVIADFEAGVPAGFGIYSDAIDGSGSSTTLNMTLSTATLPVTPTVVTNTVISLTYNIVLSGSWGGGPGYGGLSHGFSEAQDWSAYTGFSFWFYGGNTGLTFQAEIFDNGPDAAGAERFDYEFVDDFTGWQYIEIPFDDFTRATDYQPGGAPDDGLTLTQMWGYAFILAPGNGQLKLDEVALYGATELPAVSFSAAEYSVTEGETATLTIQLNQPTTEPVTVTLSVADGTATVGTDYDALMGTFVFTTNMGSILLPSESVSRLIALHTIDDDLVEDPETIMLTLSQPVNATLGSISEAILTIEDSDTPPPTTCGDRTNLIDNFEMTTLPSGEDGNGLGIGFITWQDGGGSVGLNLTSTLPVSIPTLPQPNTALQLDLDIAQWGGFSHAFENATVDGWVSQDWRTYEGLCFWLYGNNTGNQLFVDLIENRNPDSTSDDAERWTYDITDNFAGWQLFQIPFTEFGRKEIGNGAPNDGLTLEEVHGYALGSLSSGGLHTYYLDEVTIYGDTGGTIPLEVKFYTAAYGISEGETATITVTLNMTATHPVTVDYATSPGSAISGRNYADQSGTLVIDPGLRTNAFTVTTFENFKFGGNKTVLLHLTNPISANLGPVDQAVLTIVEDDEIDPTLIDDFETPPDMFDTMGNVTLTSTEVMTNLPLALPGQALYEGLLCVDYTLAASGTNQYGGWFGRHFAESDDWRAYEGLSFWFYGSNSGQSLQLEVMDNRAPDPDPAEWTLVWSDEFDGEAGSPPDPTVWTPEIGDGSLNSNPGWGNGELEYYTDNTENAAMDGDGNLVITAQEVDAANSDLECWYGPCEYTSARLISQNKAEFMHGRIEARLKVPFGQGIWPAFWMLGNDIPAVGWPQSGEIDIMENIGREPATVHGTLHGPGYSGCCGIGGGYDLPTGNLSDEFHVFAIEWEADVIRWYIDDVNFFTATVDDVPEVSDWVYNHPFFFIMNVAVGGNWPGFPDETTTFPQTMHIDYVRVYQAADSAERFTYTFTDNATGWQRITVPFSALTRSEAQPPNAPNDGLTLSEVWGYGFNLPANSNNLVYFDQVRLVSEVPVETGYQVYMPLILK